VSLIEKAVQRLEELKRAGVDLPDEAAARVGTPELREAPPADRASGPAARYGPDEPGGPESHREPDRTIGISGAGRTAATPALVEHSPLRSAPAVGTAAEPRSVPPPKTVSRSVELDLPRLAANGIVTPDTPRSQTADEYRVIKRPLLLNAEGKGAVPVQQGNVIMVTSSMPGEGKTFSSINLAMSIAMELDKTVLLVDADVARPSVLRVLGLPSTKGLMDTLTGDQLELKDVLLKTNVEKLSILPAGTSHARATEFLASDSMIRLLEEMATRYSDRIIIFDSPPLLVTTEARTLASHMGQVVLVVEAEKTTHSSVKQALATIEACPVKLLMLNKGARSKAGGYGGYYGYYGYGGYGYGEKTDKA
jgi:receptor protein-tyrosine kinase